MVDLAASDDFPSEKLTGIHSVTKGAAHLVFALLGLAYGYVRRRFAFPGGTAPENARLVQALTGAAAAA